MDFTPEMNYEPMRLTITYWTNLTEGYSFLLFSVAVFALVYISVHSETRKFEIIQVEIIY